MTDVPAVTPVTMPEEEPIVAFELLMLQTPPPVRSPSVVVSPTHTLSVPVIDEGKGSTVMGNVAEQPVVVEV